MKKQTKQLLALMLAVFMMVSVFAGCERRKTITTVTSEIEEGSVLNNSGVQNESIESSTTITSEVIDDGTQDSSNAASTITSNVIDGNAQNNSNVSSTITSKDEGTTQNNSSVSSNITSSVGGSTQNNSSVSSNISSNVGGSTQNNSSVISNITSNVGGSTQNNSSVTSNITSNVGGSTQNNSSVSSVNSNVQSNGVSNNNGTGTNVESNAVNSGSSSDLKKLEGTTVTYATWKDPALNEDGIVVKSFENKYKMKVKIDLIPQEKYIEILSARIVSGKSPDICFDNGEFPNSLQVLQSLDAAKIDFTDPIWDKEFINHTTLNGKKYLVNTVSNIWNEYTILYYNKKIFNNYGIKTPDKYYEEGNWTWDTMENVLKEVKQKAGKGINGAIIEQDKMLATLGTDFYKYDPINHTFSNGTKDAIFLPAMKRLAGWFIDGYINSGTFADGKTAMCITDLFGLKKTGYWATMNTNDVGFTYVPNWDDKTQAKPAGIFRGWGLVKGAKNPEGAGVFLRHYLDVNNYDTSSAFISKEAETFFFKVSGVSSANKVYCVSRGVSNLAGNAQTYSNDIALVYMSEINQVDKKIEEMQNKLNAAVNKSNEAIQKYTK